MKIAYRSSKHHCQSYSGDFSDKDEVIKYFELGINFSNVKVKCLYERYENINPTYDDAVEIYNKFGFFKRNHLVGTYPTNKLSALGIELEVSKHHKVQRFNSNTQEAHELLFILEDDVLNYTKYAMLNNELYTFNNSRFESEHKEKATFDVVIARYNEDIEYWVELCKQYKHINFKMFNKGPTIDAPGMQNFHIYNLENVGREGHTYARYIIDNYASLSDYILFSQGNPLDLVSDSYLRWSLEHFTVKFAELSKIYALCHIEKVCNEYTSGLWDISPAFPEIFESKSENSLEYIRSQILENKKEFLHEICIKQNVPKLFFYNIGANFIVSKDRVLNKHLSEWISIENILAQSASPPGGYGMEKLWWFICHA